MHKRLQVTRCGVRCPIESCDAEFSVFTADKISITKSAVLKHLASHRGLLFLYDGGRCLCGKTVRPWQYTTYEEDVLTLEHVLACPAVHSMMVVFDMEALGPA